MPANDRAVEQHVTFPNSPPLALPMRTHDNQAPSFQPQPGATTSHAATPHRPEGTFPSQAIAASPTNPFPRRPHEVYMGEPVAARKPVAQAETQTAPESRTTHTERLQFRLTAPGQPESDLPPWHSGLTMRAPQRSPSALDLPWREMQSTSTIGQPQDRSEQETDPVGTPITTLSELAQPLQRQEEAGEAEDAGEEEKELQPKRLGEFSQPLVQRGMDVEAATFGKGEDAGGGDRPQRQFNLYAPGQAPPDLPQRHGTQARWALQRSPIAAEPYWYRGKPLQAKLTIGQPNDAYEQEADRVAEQVMSMALPATPNVQRQVEEDEPEAMQMKPLTDTITPLVQRQEMLEEQEPLQANCEDCEQEKPIQRSADRVPQVQPDLESRLNASQGGGSALPDEVRSFMEPRFGADFSQVRVYTGNEAVQMNQDLRAQAFTHKQDIYFGAGKNPGNNVLTAHELTHVVQQTSTVQPQVQCFQAGEKGHQKIENLALAEANFASNEVAETYLGNWLRDFSQFKDTKVGGFNVGIPLVQILALGEFGKEIKPNDIGTYIPSEHIDNPAGGKTIEDIDYAEEGSEDPEKKKNFDEEWKKLTPAQQQEYRDLKSQKEVIKERSEKSKLPVYIEKSKEHTKKRFREAIRYHETLEGRMELGNGLHAFEDYFSHSNFTEAAILTLKNRLPKNAKPTDLSAEDIRRLRATQYFEELAKDTPLQSLEKASNLDENGKPKIVTGTYVGGANKMVSLLEGLASEAETGQLRTSLIKGLLKKNQITVEAVAKAIGSQLGRPIKPIAGIAGGLVGAGLGIGSGVVEGGRTGGQSGGNTGKRVGEELGQILSHSNIGGKVGRTVGELVGEGVGGILGGISGGADGASKGFDEGKAQGEQTGEKLGEQVSELSSEVIEVGIYGLEIVLIVAGTSIMIATGLRVSTSGVVLDALAQRLILSSFPQLAIEMASLIALVRSESKKLKEELDVDAQIKKSRLEADKAADVAKASGKLELEKELRGPTHSEVSKDAPDHKFFDVSTALAREAVTNVGKAMKKAWDLNKDRDKSESILDEEAVTNLVDKYICYPDTCSWWEPIVLKAAKISE